jgi:microcystin-dependent protein
MATLTVTKTYQDGDVLLESDLDGIKSSIETFLNITGLNDDNIQDGGITGSTKLVNGSVTQAKLASDAVTTAKVVDGSVTIAKLASAVTAKIVPVGAVVSYPAASAPTGWLACDGTAISRTTYSDLFAVIGTSHGSGDGATTFHLPDYRGRFLRGVDGGVARDPDRASRTAMNTGGATGDNVGSVQADEYKSHTHSINDSGHTHTAIEGGGSGALARFQPSTVYSTSGTGTAYSGPLSSATTGITAANSGGNETRPINASVQFIIKY